MSSEDIQRAVQNLYRSDPEREWQRLERHRTEFAVTLRALDEHLPPPPAHILDCGGGPGRYAIALAQRGYTVTLFDISPELLAMARQKVSEAGVALAGYEQGTATDLARFPDNTFDAVLMMGPLYHLLDTSDRRQTLTEAYRAVKPGGTIFAAFIARYAGHRDAAAHYPARAVETPDIYDRIVETGMLPPHPDGKAGFVAYFTHPTEVEPLCHSAGLDVATVLGVEGVVSTDETQVNALTGAAWDFWVDVNYTIAHDPTIHGAVEHLLAICRKPRWRSVLKQIVARLTEVGIAYKVVGGTSLALHGLPVPVNDIDIEVSPDDAYRFQVLFDTHIVMPVALRESAHYRSHIGRFHFDGQIVEIMGGLHWRSGDLWTPSFLFTEDIVDLDGIPVRVPEVEEEALTYLRRGRLDRAALCLRHCNPERFQILLRHAITNNML